MLDQESQQKKRFGCYSTEARGRIFVGAQTGKNMQGACDRANQNLCLILQLAVTLPRPSLEKWGCIVNIAIDFDWKERIY